MTRGLIGVLLSGRGSNFKAILEGCRRGEIPGAIGIVISDNPNAQGLEIARQAGIPAVALDPALKRKERNERIAELLRECGVELVCLAGYMRILGPEVVNLFPGRVLNVHPALLPAFPGLEAQRQALEYGVRFAGCTVHFVDNELDHGPIPRRLFRLGFWNRNTGCTPRRFASFSRGSSV